MQHVADRLGDRVRRLVFVDAWVLHDGQAINDVLPEPLVTASIAAPEQSPDRSVAMDPVVWAKHFMNGAPAELIDEVVARLVPVPFGWLSEAIRLPDPASARIPVQLRVPP